MKYCGNLACAHRTTCGAPAELLDHVVRCPDCGGALVEDPVVAEAGVSPLAGTRGYREAALAPAAPDAQEAARADVNVGAVIMVSSVVAPVLAYVASGWLLPCVVAVVPFFYGIQRMERGFRARRPEKAAISRK